MRRVTGTLAAAAAGALLAGALPQAALAASSNVGTGPYSRGTAGGRCEGSLDKSFCLWYRFSASEAGVAYHAVITTPFSLGDLSGFTFSGGRSGNGQAVRNNAAAMDCTVYVPTKCTTYYSVNFVGNSDYSLWGVGGRLNQTWNNEASYKLT